MTGKIRFLPDRHPANRLHGDMKAEFARARESILPVAFPSAFEFCERVFADLKLSVPPPDGMRDQPAADVADREMADLVSLFAGILASSDVPASAARKHAENLSRRAQLIRAFERPDTALQWVAEKVVEVVGDLPKTAEDIEMGRNPGDVLDPYLLAANQALLCEGDFRRAIGATVAHKALMILEALMGHLHEAVIGRMRGNVRSPEPRADNAEIFDFESNPFPGADVVQPPTFEGDCLKLHQIKSKTGTMNSSGGKRLAEQLRQLRMNYPGVELYSHAIVGNTLRGHRSMGGMLRVEPSLIVLVGQASFRALTGSDNGAEMLVRIYQAAFEMAAEETGYSVENMARLITQTFVKRSEEEGDGYLETVLYRATRGDPANLDSRTYRPARGRT